MDLENEYDPVKSLMDTAAYMIDEGEDIGPTAQWLQGALNQYVEPEEAQHIVNEFFFKRSKKNPKKDELEYYEVTHEKPEYASGEWTYVGRPKEAASAMPSSGYFHYSPVENRDEIQRAGLVPQDPGQSDQWSPRGQIPGIYAWRAKYLPVMQSDMDLWHIPHTEIQTVPIPDPKVRGAVIIPHAVRPTLIQRPSEDHTAAWEEMPKTAVMTLPQQQRAWQALNEQYPSTSQVVHTFPDDWTIQHHTSDGDVWRVGRMMRNCWQPNEHEMMLDADPAASSAWRGKTMALHDPNDIPRVAFYGGNNTISQALGPRNQSPSSEDIQRLQEFGRQYNYDVPTFYPQKKQTLGGYTEEQIGNYACPECNGLGRIQQRTPVGEIVQNAAQFNLDPQMEVPLVSCPACNGSGMDSEHIGEYNLPSPKGGEHGIHPTLPGQEPQYPRSSPQDIWETAPPTQEPNFPGGKQNPYYVPNYWDLGPVRQGNTREATSPYTTRDPMICQNCGRPTPEPYQIGRDWFTTCSNCRTTTKVPDNSPMLERYKNEWVEYPELLKEVATPAPWTFLASKKTHPNYRTGEPCECGFDWTKSRRRATSFTKTADKLHDFLMNPKSRPDLQTPEGQSFLNHMKQNYHNEKTDALMPWLAREWKKGQFAPEGPRIFAPEGPRIYPYYYEAPILNPNTGEMEPTRLPLGSYHLNHWADFYHSRDPERAQLGDIMQHNLGSYHNLVNRWDEGMQQRAEQADADKMAQAGDIVHTYPDNWTVRQLGPEDLEAEGDAMGHCVGGYGQYVDQGRSMIYSLRDPKGAPHATWEISPTRPYGETYTPSPENLHNMANEIEQQKPELANWMNEYFVGPGQTEPRAWIPALQRAHEEYNKWGDAAHGRTYQQVVERGLDKNLIDMHRQGEHFFGGLKPQFRQHVYPYQPPVPHEGEVVQIQGKGNQEPIPEYKERIKNWFDTFSPEEKPQWDPQHQDSGYELWDPSDIRDEDLNPHPYDAYGLNRPLQNVDWPAMMSNMTNSYGGRADWYQQWDPDWSQRAYQLAVNRGEIPQFATALGNWHEKAVQPSYDRLEEDNWEGQPPDPESSPEYYEGFDDPYAEYDRQMDDYHKDLTNLHPQTQAVNHMYGLLAPHWDETTNSYQNIPEQPGTAPQQGTLSHIHTAAADPVVEAMHSWRGWPSDMGIHMSNELEGAPLPDSGNGKAMRAQARALLNEMATNPKPIPTLYRGSSTPNHWSWRSWSEDPKVAAQWAKLSGGQVYTLPAGSMQGLRMADYIFDPESQWLVDHGPRTAKQAALAGQGYSAQLWHGTPYKGRGIFPGMFLTSHRPEAEAYGADQGEVTQYHVNFANPIHLSGENNLFGMYTPDAVAKYRQAGFDGIVVHHPEDYSDFSNPMPERQWAIALDPQTVQPVQRTAYAGIDLQDDSAIEAMRQAERQREYGDPEYPGGCHSVTECLEGVQGAEQEGGFYLHPEYMVDHQWMRMPDGSIIDPTYDQFGTGVSVGRWPANHPMQKNYIPWSHPDIARYEAEFEYPEDFDNSDTTAKQAAQREGMAADPNDWAQYVQRNPVLFHATNDEKLPSIMQNGLMPGHDSLYEGDLQSRPGHVYLAPNPKGSMGAYRHWQVRGKNPVMLGIDPSYLSHEHVNPDEDYMDERKVPLDWSFGPWAESQGYGDNLNDTGKVLGQNGTIAYRGSIPPEALSVYERGEDGWKRTAQADQYWTHEQCGSVALALHNKTGWPIHRLMDGPDVAHVYVVHPNGQGVDARGMRPIEQIHNDYPAEYQHQVVPTTAAQLQSMMSDKDDDKPLYGYDPEAEQVAASLIGKNEYTAKLAALTRAQRLQQAQELEAAHGVPDTSVPVHQFSNGWSIRKPQTYADLNREGGLMSNCFGLYDVDTPHQIWGDHPECGAEWPEGEERPHVVRPEEGIENWNVPLPEHQLYSLRDQDNLPHASIDLGAEHQVLGQHNADPKPEYQQMVNEWQGQPVQRMAAEWPPGPDRFEPMDMTQAMGKARELGHEFVDPTVGHNYTEYTCTKCGQRLGYMGGKAGGGAIYKPCVVTQGGEGYNAPSNVLNDWDIPATRAWQGIGPYQGTVSSQTGDTGISHSNPRSLSDHNRSTIAAKLAYGEGDTSWANIVPPVPSEDTGIRVGDPSITEHLGQSSGSRGTGHFGTGIYFGSHPDRVSSGWDIRNNVPLHGIDLTGYNLYKPRDFQDALNLHGALKTVNTLASNEPGWGIPETKGTSDPDEFALQKARINIPHFHKNEPIIRQAIDDVRNDVASVGWPAGYPHPDFEGLDSASTRVMKGLGYHGIDTRHIPEMDNTMYGSVLYRPDNPSRLSNSDITAKQAAQYYHVAPSVDRDRINTHGLFPSNPKLNWQQTHPRAAPGIYANPTLEEAQQYRDELEGKRGAAHDIWEVPGGLGWAPDPENTQAFTRSMYFQEPIPNPRLVEGPEDDSYWWDQDKPQSWETKHDLGWDFDPSTYRGQQKKNLWGIGLPDRVLGAVTASAALPGTHGTDDRMLYQNIVQNGYTHKNAPKGVWGFSDEGTALGQSYGRFQIPTTFELNNPLTGTRSDIELKINSLRQQFGIQDRAQALAAGGYDGFITNRGKIFVVDPAQAKVHLKQAKVANEVPPGPHIRMFEPDEWSTWDDEDGYDPQTLNESWHSLDPEDEFDSVPEQAANHLMDNGLIEPSSSRHTTGTWYSDPDASSRSGHLYGMTPEQEREVWAILQSQNLKHQIPQAPSQTMMPVDPWMDNEPGTLTYPEHWGRKVGMALNPEDAQEYIRQHGPYLHHWTRPENIPDIMQRGILPGTHPKEDPTEEEMDYWDNEYEPPQEGDIRKNWEGFIETRPGYTYMARPDWNPQISMGNNPHPYQVPLRIDLRKLDPKNLEADEDVARTLWPEWKEQEQNRIRNEEGREPEHWEPEWMLDPPDSSYWDGESSWDVPSWADEVGLDHPEWTNQSLMDQNNGGAIAHRGPIPPEAISLHPDYMDKYNQQLQIPQTLSHVVDEEVQENPEDAFPSSSLGQYLYHLEKHIKHKPAPKKSYREIFAKTMIEVASRDLNEGFLAQ